MVQTQEEMLLSILAKDNTASGFSSVNKNAQSMSSKVCSVVSSMNSAMMNFGRITDSTMQSLTGKSAMDNIMGTTSKNETNMVLLRNMLDDQEKNFDSFYKTVDQTTDESLTSMQELIPALKAFKSATAASDKDVQDITDDMANFGAAVLAQTGSTDLAQGAMMDLSKGIKGAFAALDQYGITEDSLKRNGWSGEESDVKSFMEAVTKVTGSTEDLMETNQGLDALIGKAFSRAGKKIGNDFLPVIKDVKNGFLELDKELGGNLTASILAVSAGIDAGNNALWNFSTAVKGVRDVKDVVLKLNDALRGTKDAAEAANNAMDMGSNISQMGTDIGSAVGAGSDVAKTASQSEKAIDAGMDTVNIADTISDLKSKNKYDIEAIKEATQSIKSSERLEKELDSAREAEAKLSDLISKKESAQKNIDSGVFGSGMLKEFEKEIQSTEKEIDTIVGTDLWSGVESKFKPNKNINYFEELLNDDSLKDGRKTLAEIQASRKDNFSAFDKLVKGNDEAKKKAEDTLKSLTQSEWDDKLMEEWEQSDWGLTDAIKNKGKNFKLKIMGAFDSISDFNLKGAITSPFKSVIKSIKGFNFGESLQSGLEKSMGGIGNITATVKKKFGDIGSSLERIKDIDLGSKLEGLDKKAYQSISDFSFKDTLGGLKDYLKGTSETGKVIENAGNMSDEVIDATQKLKNTKNISEGIETVSEVGSTVSAAAPAMEEGAAGAEAASVGAAGLSASFTSMIVPLLALSATIIIMIPIVAVIAAEAMIFLKLLGEFMEALNFDSINLDGAIKGISQIATALAWVGVAMAAMTFTSIMTGLAVITGGVTDILGPLDTAVKALKDASSKLAQFNSLTINPSVADNIKNIAESLTSVSNAMMALTWNNITTGFSNWISGVLGFSSVTDGLEQAKNDIIEASAKLNEFSSLTPLPDNVATNIQNVCDSLASVGDAMGALRSIRDGQNWDTLIGDFLGGIFGEGVDIQTALTNVRQDIYDAAKALNGWNLPEVNEDVGKNVKAVADALTSVSDAFNILKGFRDDNIWSDMLNGIFGEGTDIGSALDKVMTDINTAASKLKELKIGDEINDDLIKNIQKVVNALTEVTNVANSLSNLPNMEKFDSNIITSATDNLQTASDKLKDLTVGEVNEDTITNIKNIANALTEVSNVMTSLSTLPPMDGFNSESIGTAVTNVQTAASELNKLNETTFNSETTDSVLGAIKTSLENLKTTLSSATGFSEPSMAIGTSIVTGVTSGLSGLSSNVQSNVSSAISSATSTAHSGGSSLGTETVNGFRSTLNLHSVMDTEMGYVKTSVDNGISAAKTAAESGAKEVVNAFKSGVNVGSPGDIARTMSGEMNYTKEAILNAYGVLKGAAYNAARTIVDAFGEPSLDVGSRFNPNNINGLQTTVSDIPYKGNTNNTTIIITEGAVQVDARNKTEREAQQMFISVLESFKPTGGI